MAKDIMYVGRKEQKVDNKNHNYQRIWRGLGQVIKGIPDLEAQKLSSHPDVWMDVTGMSAKDRATVIAALQVQYRTEQRKAREGQAILLEQANEDELEAALAKIRKERGKAVVNSVNAGLVPAAPAALGSSANATESRERPKSTDEMGEDIFGALTELDSEQDFDGQGNPYLERVTAKLGYSITQVELDAVWTAYNAKG